MRSNILQLPRIGALSTLPGRELTLAPMIESVKAQLDHIFVYLDGHAQIPACLAPSSRLTILLTRDEGALRVSTRWTCLKRLAAPALIFGLDDDILYPDDYCARLAAFLSGHGRPAIAGVQARIFRPPHLSYARDCDSLHFSRALDASLQVHEVGSGTCAFVSRDMPLEPSLWPLQDCDDICMAIEAQRRSIPRIAVARADAWLTPLAEDQPDSLQRQVENDDSRQSVQMRRLLAIYGRERRVIPPASVSRRPQKT